jgi:uncharacterized protein YjeT (DUF2065 family)
MMIDSLYSTFFTHYAPCYLIAVASLLYLYAVIELIFPERVVNFWHNFVQSKIFPFYGLVLSIGALPLTQFTESIQGKVLFAIGLIAVFTGPFMLLFPGYFRKVIQEMLNNKEYGNLKQIAYVDAVMRLISATVILLVRFL